MVPPNGESLARLGSTWIHWKSPVASANWSMRCCETSTQGETPTSSPIFDSSSRSLIAVLAMVEEPFHFPANEIRLLVHDPVRGFRRTHHLQVGHEVAQPVQQAR